MCQHGTSNPLKLGCWTWGIHKHLRNPRQEELEQQQEEKLELEEKYSSTEEQVAEILDQIGMAKRLLSLCFCFFCSMAVESSSQFANYIDGLYSLDVRVLWG